MTSHIRAAAALAVSALALTGGVGLAHAQSSALGSAEEGTGEVGPGSIDTSGSALLGEPTFGSLAPVVSQGVGSVNAAAGSDAVSPAPGTGSVDTTGSILGEPTSGSLVPAVASVGDALGSDGGPAIVIGSDGGTDSLGGSGSLGPVLLVGGSAAVIGAGIYFAPQIEQALTDAGIVLPPLPQF